METLSFKIKHKTPSNSLHVQVVIDGDDVGILYLSITEYIQYITLHRACTQSMGILLEYDAVDDLNEEE